MSQFDNEAVFQMFKHGLSCFGTYYIVWYILGNRNMLNYAGIAVSISQIVSIRLKNSAE